MLIACAVSGGGGGGGGVQRQIHEPISLQGKQGKWLRQVVRGYFAHHAVPTNCKSISTFRHYVMDLWRRALQRRSQRDRSTWERIAQLAAEFLPLPRILHPWPSEHLAVKYPRWEPGAKCSLPSYVVSGSQVVGVEEHWMNSAPHNKTARVTATRQSTEVVAPTSRFLFLDAGKDFGGSTNGG